MQVYSAIHKVTGLMASFHDFAWYIPETPISHEWNQQLEQSFQLGEHLAGGFVNSVVSSADNFGGNCPGEL